MKKIKIQAECICTSLCEEGTFYITQGQNLVQMKLNLKTSQKIE